MSKSRRNASNPASSSVHYTKNQPHLVSNQGISDPQAAGHAGIMESGHVVHPNLISQSSRLAALTKAVRSYIPSFTSLNTSIGLGTGTHEANTSASGSDQRLGSTFGSYTTTQSKAATNSTSVDQVGEDTGCGILWSRWLTIRERPYLAVAYSNGGLHIWDVSSLDAVKEVLFLPSIGIVRSLDGIPPEPSIHPGSNAYRLALVVGEGSDSVLNIYSLANHTHLKRVSIPGAVSVSSNARVTVVAIGNSQDAAKQSNGLVILSSASFELLHTIQSSELAPHTLSSPIYSLSFSRLLAYASAPPASHRPVKPTSAAGSGYPPTTVSTISTTGYLSGMNLGDVMSGAMWLGTGVIEGVKKVGEMGLDAAGYSNNNGEKRGIVSQSAPASPSPLSSRLYASSGKAKGPVTQKGHNEESEDASSEWVTVLDIQGLLDHHEQKVADDNVEAVVTSPSSSFYLPGPPLTHLNLSKQTNGGLLVETITEFMYTRNSSLDRPSKPSKRSSPAASSTHLAQISGMHTPNKAVSAIAWSPNGSLLAVAGKDGSAVRVFKVSRHPRRPMSAPQTTGGTQLNTNRDSWINEASGIAEIAYELVRGVTAAAIRSIDWSTDGLWSAAVSSHGTLHAFTVDPAGGTPNLQSYIDGRVVNSRNAHPSGARLQAVARLRQPVVPTTDSPPGTLTQRDANEVQKHLRRQSDSADLGAEPAETIPDEVQVPSCYFVPGVYSRTSRFLPAPPNTSPPTPIDSTAPTTSSNGAGAFKDVLVFDPETSLMGLWRCTLRASTKRQPASGPTQAERGSLERTTSVSGVVPKEEAAPSGGRLPSSLSSKRVISGISRIAGIARRGEGLANALSGTTEGTWEGSVIASWDLKKRDDWAETKGTFASSDAWIEGRDNPKPNYLAFAELTTFPIRSLMLPRPIYLSHQFTFAALGNDYHALVRRLDLNPLSYPVMMRKENVIMRGIDEGPGFDYAAGTSAPSDFDSDANFLGNTGPLDLTDSPMLGGHLELAPEAVPIPSSYASTSATSLSSHSQSRTGRKILRRSVDENLSSAIESSLRLDASYSPSGSSGMASPGKVIPMLPNGRPSSSGNGIGLDSIVRGTARVGKEVWGGISSVRSPRMMPTKRSSAGGSPSDLLKFDEEDEMFVVDDLDGDKLAVADIELEKAEDPATIGERRIAETTLTRDGSVRTIGPGVWTSQGGFGYPLLTDSGMTVMPPSALQETLLDSTTTPTAAKPADEGTWVAQPELYTQAVEEDARFDDVTGILDEERAEREALQRPSPATPIRKNSGLAKSGRRTSSRDIGRKINEFDADLSSDARSAASSNKGGKKKTKKKR